LYEDAFIPHKVTRQGVSITIGRVEKDGQNFLRVLYREQGKRKQAWRSSFEAAKRAANDAIEATLTGDASALKLNASDRHAYLRAVEFLAPLNITLDHAACEYAEIRIMLAGKITEQTLNQAGIVRVGDLQDYAGDLRALVGSFGPKLKQFAFEEDDRPLELGDEIKSISGEETFLKDTDDRKVLRACLKEQAADISARLKHRRLGAHTVQVKVRYSDFITLTRQISVEEPITEVPDIYRLGCFLLGREN